MDKINLLTAGQTITAIESLHMIIRPSLFTGKFGIERWDGTAQFVQFLQGSAQKFRYNSEVTTDGGVILLVSKIVQQMYEDGNLLLKQVKEIGIQPEE